MVWTWHCLRGAWELVGHRTLVGDNHRRVVQAHVKLVVLIWILQVQHIRVVLRRDACLSKCFTSRCWLLLLGWSEFILSQAYLLNRLRTSFLNKSFLFWTLTTSSSILDSPIFLSCSQWILERNTCSLHVNFLCDHFIWLFVNTFMEIVPEFILFSLCYSLFNWFKLSLFVLSGN